MANHTNVLVIAPHPDDESIGCGGTICLHAERRDRVIAVFLTSGERGIRGVSRETARSIRESEAEKAGEILMLHQLDFLRLPDLALSKNIEIGAQRLGEIIRLQSASLIYLPHPNEAHEDHQAALPIVRTALAQLPAQMKRPELRLYEVWSPMTVYGWAEDISRFIQPKLRAVRCYKSQLQTFSYDRAVCGLNQYRGALAARCRYAEVFQFAEPAPLSAEAL